MSTVCPGCHAIDRLSEEAGVKVCSKCGMVVEPLHLETSMPSTPWKNKQVEYGKKMVTEEKRIEHKFRAPRNREENAIHRRTAMVLETCGRLNLTKGCAQRAMKSLERAMDGGGWKETKLPMRAMAAAAAMRAAREDGIPLSLVEVAETTQIKARALARCDLQMRKAESLVSTSQPMLSSLRREGERVERKPGAEDFAKRALADVMHAKGMDRSALLAAIHAALVVIDLYDRNSSGIEGRNPNAIGAAAACLALPSHEEELIRSASAAPSTVKLRKKEMAETLLRAAHVQCAGDVQMALAYALTKSKAHKESSKTDLAVPMKKKQKICEKLPVAFERRDSERQRRRIKAEKIKSNIHLYSEKACGAGEEPSEDLEDWEDLLFARLLMAGATVEDLENVDDYKRLPSSLLLRAGLPAPEQSQTLSSSSAIESGDEADVNRYQVQASCDPDLRSQEEAHLAAKLLDVWDPDRD